MSEFITHVRYDCLAEWKQWGENIPKSAIKDHIKHNCASIWVEEVSKSQEILSFDKHFDESSDADDLQTQNSENSLYTVNSSNQNQAIKLARKLFSDGSVYVGDMYKGFMHGHGVLDNGKGTRYEGKNFDFIHFYRRIL